MRIPLFVSNSVFHKTGYTRNHPLSIARVGPVAEISRKLGWLDDIHYRESVPATAETLARFHAADYLSALIHVSESGKASVEERECFALGTMENPVFPGLFNRVATSVGGSILAAELAMDGRIVFHPAGGTHHGRRERASGFCYSNDPAFAIMTFLDSGLSRIAYIDLDAHHGDGVEDAFAGDERVLSVSIHEAGRWPGTGQGHTETARNFPVDRGFGDAGLATLLASEILPAVRNFAPEALVLTCGADVLKGDPLSTMQLSNRAMWAAVQAIVALAPRAAVLGGGGYNPWTTVRYWAGLWASLSGQAMPDKLPDEVCAILAGFTCDLVDDDDMDPAWLTTIADP